MNSRNFLGMRKGAIRPLRIGNTKLLHFDNTLGQKTTDTTKEALRTSKHSATVLGEKATDLCPLANYIIRQTIKTVCRWKWSKKNRDMIQKNEWIDWKSWSGKFHNLGKTFYVKLDASVIRKAKNEHE